jgi:chromosomal replication initiation ATPase DnaA
MQELEKTLDNVCTILNVNKQEVKGKSKKEDLVRARAVFSYIARDRNTTFCTIANILHRDHSTIIYLVNLVKNMDNYIKLKNDFEKVVYGRSIC